MPTASNPPAKPHNMAPARATALSPEKRKGREILTPRAPHIESLLAGLDLDPEILASARRACNNLWRWRNEFDVKRRRAGLFGKAGLSKADAPHALFRALAELDQGGER
jgi:hypothetical protein